MKLHLLIANIINISADIGAMAASVRLIIPQLPIVVTRSFTSLILALETVFIFSLLELSIHLKGVVKKVIKLENVPIWISSLYALDYSYFTSILILLHVMFLTVMLRKLFCSTESYATLFTSQRPTGTCTIWPRRS
jgi:hypothetical protein